METEFGRSEFDGKGLGSGRCRPLRRRILSERRAEVSGCRVRETCGLRWWRRCYRCRCGGRLRRGRCGRGDSRRGWSPGGSWRRRLGEILTRYSLAPAARARTLLRQAQDRLSRLPAGRRRYFKSNRACFVYFDPFGDSWLWYRKNSRAVMVPNSGVGRTASFSCSRWKTRFGPSVLVRRGEAERPAPRASVRCGLKARSSFGIPSEDILSSMATARVASCGPASMPIQKTRADFAVGKKP